MAQDVGQPAFFGFDDGAGAVCDQSAQHGVGVLDVTKVPLPTSLLAGTPDWVVSRRPGHAHVQTTLDLYGWVREDEALQAAANWRSYAAAWQVNGER